MMRIIVGAANFIRVHIAETLGEARLGAVLLVTGSHDLNPFVEGF